MRSLCFKSILLSAALGLATAACSAERPNVVFILADDLGWRDLSGEGSDFYETPFIDRIGRSGARFMQAYATCQVCSPSRASILTGKYPARLGITTWIGDRAEADWKRNTELLPAAYRRELPQSEVTLAEVFQNAGYKTFFAGKWHLGDSPSSAPEENGFDVNKGGYGSGSPRGGYFSPYKNPKLEDGPDGENLSLRLASETARFIEENRDGPFFAVLSFYAVHSPLQTTREKWSKYRDKAERTGNDQPKFWVDRTLPVRQTQDNPVYAGLIETMDTAVGEVLSALERFGLSENTIVVFTSDNGGVSAGDGRATSNLPLRGGKGRQWEGGIRVPAYLALPGVIDPGLELDYPITGADFYPTLLDLAGLPSLPEQHVDGVSLEPLFGGDSLPKRPLFWHYPHYGNQGGDPTSIVRLGDWKLIRYHDGRSDELYHLAEDLGERSDQASRHAELVGRLGRMLDQWLDSVEARFPSPNPNFDQRERAEWLRKLDAVVRAKEEEKAAAMLEPDWQPNQDWWRSSVTE